MARCRRAAKHRRRGARRAISCRPRCDSGGRTRQRGARRLLRRCIRSRGVEQDCPSLPQREGARNLDAWQRLVGGGLRGGVARCSRSRGDRQGSRAVRRQASCPGRGRGWLGRRDVPQQGAPPTPGAGDERRHLAPRSRRVGGAAVSSGRQDFLDSSRMRRIASWTTSTLARRSSSPAIVC